MDLSKYDLNIEIIANDGDTDYQSQINFAAQNVETEYMSILEFDDEVSKINGIFEDVDFDIEKNWEQLVNARNTARSISDKLIPDNKLNSDFISKIYWIGPNKNDDCQEDIVIETNDGSQYSFYLCFSIIK